MTRYTIVILTIAIVSLSSDALAFNFNKKDEITISNNRGGHLIKYALQAKKLARDQKKVRIAGRCDSACTMYLTMPRQLTCITPNAKFGFHLPYGSSAKNNVVAAKYMIRSYPGWVKQWIADNNGLSRDMKTMTYSYARQYVKTCD